jgi:hypothetical protein
MRAVTLALYAEGTTDGDFLPKIIERTTKSILSQHSSQTIQVRLPYSKCNKPVEIVKRDQCILYVARETASYDALIIHSDGDHRGYEQTLSELFQPGKKLVLDAKDRNEDICADLVPLIPVRMTEAWMLADSDALCTVLGKKVEARTLGIPTKAKLVEKELNPKKALDHAIQVAYPHQSRDWKRFKAKLYKELGSQINLKRLNEVPSYQQFVDDLTATLQSLNFIQIPK